MSKEVKINYNNTFATQHSRDYYRGASFHWSGEWMVGAHYLSDDYNIDYVVHGQVLLACAKSHLSTLENEPKDFIRDESGTVIGVVSTYWDFVLSGIVGKSPGIKIQDNYWYICKDTGVPEEEQVWENTGVKAKMELSDLTPEEIEILQRPGKEVVTEFVNNTMTQSTGQDPTKIMSQKATTDVLNTKASNSALSAAIENEVLRANNAYQPKGDYATNTRVDGLQEELNTFKGETADNFDLVRGSLKTLQDNIADVAESIPTKVSELENDSNYQTKTNVETLLEPIKAVIPQGATALNQLADKAFVNSSIATSTANFRGTSAVGLTEAQFLAWANGLTHDENDYIYWNTVDSVGNVVFKRYKYSNNTWVYEYDLNNSSFTADEWAAIQSNITSALVTKLSDLPNNSDLTNTLNNKVDKITGKGLSENDYTNSEKEMNSKNKTRLDVDELVVSEHIAKLHKELQNIIENIDNLGNAHARTLSIDEMLKICDCFLILEGTDAPNFSPDFVGQVFYDTTNRAYYIAFDNSSTSDWVRVSTKSEVDTKVDKVSGKGLSANDISFSKQSAQDLPDSYSVSVHDYALGTDSNIDLGVKFSSTDWQKLQGIASNAQVNVLEGVKVDGTELTITDKKVNIDISGKANKSEMGVSTSGDKTTITLKSGTSAEVLNSHQSLTFITEKIPEQASSSNQLADKEFVNSSISTATATFRGTSASGLTEEQFLTWANTLTKDSNDYIFWNTADSIGNIEFRRYKYNGSSWVYEYTLNNSSFTDEQWAAIQSGITSGGVTKLNGIESNAQVNIIEHIQINGTEQTISSKTVNLPAYPTTLPASDVYEWAKASTKPSYNLSEIGNADDVKAIENLSGTSGFLKKTAANSWSLDTNTYITARDLSEADLLTRINTLAYGIQWSKNSSTCTRIGNPLLHRTLPIQSQMKGCVEKNGEPVYWLDPSNWAYKANGDPSILDGTDGYVRDYIPRFYGRSWDTEDYSRVMISTVKIDDTWVEIPEHFEDAYESALDRTNLKLCSVVNTSAQYRGGTNSSTYDSYEAMRSLLGKPATNFSRANARTYASNAGSELLGYNIYKWVFLWLPVIEYANFDLQTAINNNLTAEGYHQGGLGNGATTFSPWGAYNGYNPIIPCGLTNSLGNFSGQVGIDYSAFDSYSAGTVYANRYRGLECPFGDVWTNLDGIIVDANHSDYDLVYTCNDPSKYSDSITSAYINTSRSIHTDGYVKEFDLGNTGEITAISVGGGKADYHYTGSVNSTLRTVRAGGYADNGGMAGPGCLYSDGGVSGSNASVGFRTIKRIY